MGVRSLTTVGAVTTSAVGVLIAPAAAESPGSTGLTGDWRSQFTVTAMRNAQPYDLARLAR